MARSRYEYGTSPRKIEPDVQRHRTSTKTRTAKQQQPRRNLRVVEDLPKKDPKVLKEERRVKAKLSFAVGAIFLLLLTISYRNSQINEKFNNVQNLKKELSSIQKENEQLKVNIENDLNLSTIEKQAKEKLGMQKLTNKQTVYVSLPKKDYVEPASEEVVREKEKSWLEKLIDKILNK